MENLISFTGFIVIGLTAWLFCSDKKQIKWRPVFGGILIQVILAMIVFHLPAAKQAFLLFNDIFLKLLAASREGILFVFGPLGAENSPLGLVLAFQSFPFIIVFSALMSILYYLGFIPYLINAFAYILSKTLKTSGAESLCAAANIFTGIESETAIRPYLSDMTHSELFLIITVGMSTVASSMMAVYVTFISPVFPAIAGHLISASFISVPSAFIIAKLMEPETGIPSTAKYSTCRLYFKDADKVPQSVVEAAIVGGHGGYKLAVGVAVTLICFLGILGILRGLLSYFSDGALTFDNIFSIVFYPAARLIGVSAEDTGLVANLLGERIIFTEIPAFMHLSELAKSGTCSPRTILVASYALCGFAHIASMAIFIGGTAALIPARTRELSHMSLKALLAATLATLMTGTIAGIFYWGNTGILQQ